MRKKTLLIISVVTLGLALHALAPIVEQSPSPSPTVSPKAKANRPRENSIAGKATATPAKLSPRPTSSATDSFDGTWTGTYKRGWMGEVAHTYVISGHGTLLRETIGASETHVWSATCDGTTMRWSWSLNVLGLNSFTPARDGKTGVFTVKRAGKGGYETSTVFPRISALYLVRAM